MKLNCSKLGDYIEQVNIKNVQEKNLPLLGVTLDKKFIPSVANTVGVDFSKYKIVKKNQFACKLMSVGRDEALPVSLLKNFDEALVSSAYYVFHSENVKKLNPLYLEMWLNRKETDRWVGFVSGGDVRGSINWETFCELPIVVPSLQKQQEIVHEYYTLVNRIELNEKLNQKLENTAQTLYKRWFEDFEFPINKKNAEAIGKPELEGYPYKSSGGKMSYDKGLEQEVPSDWDKGSLSDLCSYTSNREKVRNLTTKTYLSTENMLANRGGITISNNLPNAVTTTKYNKNDILISNIRPYFKKIWFATFSGGCSNDILCFVPNDNVNPLFLYFSLERDSFFDYIMQGAKGTKMPRGDKDWIINYSIALPDEDVMCKFSHLVDSLVRNQQLRSLENDSLKKMSHLVLSNMANPVAFQTEEVI